MVVQRKYLLCCICCVVAYLNANTGIAKDLILSKHTVEEGSAKISKTKKSSKSTEQSIGKMPKTKKMPPKPLSRVGSCVVMNNLLSLSKSDCARKKGSFYTNKNQAQKSLARQKKGFCLSQSKVISATAGQCKKSGGQFHDSKRNAAQSYEKQKGFCLRETSISASNRSSCSGKGAQFFKDRQQAKKVLSKIKGFCLRGSTVAASTFGQCLNKRGTFYTERGDANKKAAIMAKTKSSHAKLPASVRETHPGQLSRKAQFSGGPVSRYKPGVERSSQFEDRIGNRHLQDQMAAMREAQAAKGAGLMDVNPAGGKTRMTDPMTGDPLSIAGGFSVMDPETGDEQNFGRRSGRDSFSEWSPFGSNQQTGGSGQTDELREIGRRGKGMAMADDSDAGTPASSTSNEDVNPEKTEDMLATVNDNTPVHNSMTFEEAQAAFGDGESNFFTVQADPDNGNFVELTIGVPGGVGGDTVEVTQKDLRTGVATVTTYVRGKKPVVTQYTEHPDEQRNSRKHGKKKTLTDLDLAGNYHPDEQQNAQGDKKKKVFRDDELAGTPHEEQEEQHRTLSGPLTGSLTMSGTPVEQDLDFGTIDPSNPSGNTVRSVGSDRQERRDASLPEAGNQRNLEGDRQQEEPGVVVPDSE